MPAPTPEQELAMMLNPDKWPLWPFLPLKNLKEREGGWPKPAVLYSPYTKNNTLYLHEGKSLHDKLNSSEAKKVTKEELREMIAAGWVVD